jgi:peptidoglycan/LPS O-acetylase OafA/YrhL
MQHSDSMPLTSGVAMPPAQLALVPLDGVRALCCVLIICGHLFMYGVPRASDGGPYPLVGLEFFSAVSMFMALSGFTLVAVYADAAFDAAGLRAFLRRRMARLAPLYYVSLVVALPWLLLYTSTTSMAVSVPVALLMLQSLTGPVGAAWNGPLWQISALLLCYLAFPLALPRLKSLPVAKLHRLLTTLAIVAFILPLVVIGAVFSLGGGFAGATFIHMFGPFRCLQFLMGMVGGLLARNSEGGTPRATLDRLTAVLVVCGAAVLITVSSIGDATLRFYAWMALNYLAEYALPLLHVRWLVALTTAPAGRISAALTLPAMQWVGNAS